MLPSKDCNYSPSDITANMLDKEERGTAASSTYAGVATGDMATSSAADEDSSIAISETDELLHGLVGKIRDVSLTRIAIKKAGLKLEEGKALTELRCLRPTTRR